MKSILPLILICAIFCGCMSSQSHQVETRAVQAIRRGAYEKQAWRAFQAADYAQALKMAYRATAVNPEAPGPALITGLIYDHVYDRPDLALLEYDRLQRLTPDRPELQILQLRLKHLFRRAQLRSAIESLKPESPPPLNDAHLALFPFQVWSNNNTHQNLALGLIDLLVFDLETIIGHDQLSVLRLHALQHQYRKTHPQASGADFAKWSGATYTLIGEIAPQNEHLVVVSARLVNANGETVQTLPQITLGPGDLPLFRRIILSELALYLNLELPASFEPQPSTSLVALGLHAQGLSAYLSNNLDRANYFFNGALILDPNAPLFVSRQQWVTDDLQGAQYTNELSELYQQLLTRPLPEIALQRRLNTTHALLAPSRGIESGTEALSPYKPPQPGGTQ